MTKFTYSVRYRLDFHPLAPSGFYSYVCLATTAREAKRIVRQRIGGQLQEKHTVGLIRSVPTFSDMHARRI